MAEVKLNIAAFITILKNPKLKIVIGKDSKNKIGFTVIFNKANTKLAPNAIHTLST